MTRPADAPETTVAHWDDRKSPWTYIGRVERGGFGNPFIIGSDGTRAEVLVTYRRWFNQMLGLTWFRESVEALRGRQLVCHCKPLACHGDVIAEYLNGLS